MYFTQISCQFNPNEIIFFNLGAELTVDDRTWMMSLVPSMTPLAIQQFLYPRIFTITSLGSSITSDGAGSLKNDSRGVASSTSKIYSILLSVVFRILGAFISRMTLISFNSDKFWIIVQI